MTTTRTGQPVEILDTKVPIELVRPSFYGMLVCYYAGIATYGVTASIWTLPSLIAQGGDTFAVAWAIVLGAAALLAMIGVLISRHQQNRWVELVATLLMVCMLIGYGAGLLMRGLAGSPAAIPTAWLPLIIAVLPGWRILVMVADGSLNRRPRR
jgi:hypothetical protein